jgi:hypothetical protein
MPIRQLVAKAAVGLHFLEATRDTSGLHRVIRTLITNSDGDWFIDAKK